MEHADTSPGSFDRQLAGNDDRRLIRSVCRRCGAVIVGSVMETLVEDEQGHAEQCHEGRRRSGRNESSTRRES